MSFRPWLAALAFCLISGRAFAFACTMTATNVAFGNVNVTTGASVANTGTLSLHCTASPLLTTIRMCVDINGGSASNPSNRLMNGPGAAQLGYQLYTNSGHTTPWGSWSAGLYGGGFTWDVATGVSPTVNATTTVYGLVLGSQPTITPGAYSSTLTLFFTYNNSNANPCPRAGQGNSTTTFTATATVLTACAVSATTLNFGTVALLNNPVAATSTLTVTCSNATPYTVSLNGGLSGAVNPTLRKMTQGAAQITYGLYRDAAHTLPWGSTIGTNTASGTGSGVGQALTVYGLTPTQTTPAPALYQDTIIATVTY